MPSEADCKSAQAKNIIIAAIKAVLRNGGDIL